MEIKPQDWVTTIISMTESSQVGEARRRARVLGQMAGLDDVDQGRLGTIVTEAATNLIKHGIQGQVLLRMIGAGSVKGVEILALDRGPGITNVDACLQDGFSTTGTPGTGLGAVRRLATNFDLYSQLKIGTILWAEVWPSSTAAEAPMSPGAICVPFTGERYCGDCWGYGRPRAGVERILVVDGLGHGDHAAEAAQACLEVFHASHNLSLVDLTNAAHVALRKTRGAAMAVMEWQCRQRQFSFVGVGNIAGCIAHPMADNRLINLISNNGIIGHQLSRVQEFVLTVEPGSRVMIHSDGITSRWTIDSFPGILWRAPVVQAAAIWRGAQRGRDDSTMIVHVLDPDLP